MNVELIERLTHVSGKLRQLWGENEDSQVIDQAIVILETPEAAPAPAKKAVK